MGHESNYIPCPSRDTTRQLGSPGTPRVLLPAVCRGCPTPFRRGVFALSANRAAPQKIFTSTRDRTERATTTPPIRREAAGHFSPAVFYFPRPAFRVAATQPTPQPAQKAWPVTPTVRRHQTPTNKQNRGPRKPHTLTKELSQPTTKRRVNRLINIRK